VLVSEETVRVGLGDDYYHGAYFRTVDTDLDYEVPRSQLERWEAASAAYDAMQDEIGQVMEQQRHKALTLMLERRKGKPHGVSKFVQAAYEDAITKMLQQSSLLSGKEGS
jgi:hypothetical protein